MFAAHRALPRKPKQHRFLVLTAQPTLFVVHVAHATTSPPFVTVVLFSCTLSVLLLVLQMVLLRESSLSLSIAHATRLDVAALALE